MKSDRVLLMRREGSGYQDGELSLPAGHVEGGEDVVSALQRELLGELGINVQRSSCSLARTVHRAVESPGGSEYVFAVREWERTPRIREPAKYSELLWAHPCTLPRDVVDHVAAVLEAVRARQPLVLRGWD